MVESLLYKPHAEAICQRLAALWSRRLPEGICARMVIPSPALVEFARTHEDGPTTYPDPHMRIEFWDRCLAFERHIEDDWLPIAYLSEFDQGLFGSLCGGTMAFMTHREIGWISSMCAPCMTDLAQVADLRIDPAHPMLERLDRQLAVFAEGARGKFGVAPFIVIDALNFVAELRGMTQAFLDVLESPEAVRAMMDFALQLNIFVFERVYAALDGFAGGSFVNMGSWAPGRPLLVSVDAYHLAAPAFFEEWGRPWIQPLLNHFGGGLLHLHSNGRHLLPAVGTMPGLVCVYLLNEPWSERAYDALHTLHARANGVPLVVDCRWDEFVRDLDAHRLPGNVLYQVSGAPSVAEANRMMERVRAYRAA